MVDAAKRLLIDALAYGYGAIAGRLKFSACWAKVAAS